MKRWLALLALMLGLTPAAEASRDLRANPTAPRFLRPDEQTRRNIPSASQGEFSLTDETEVLLDGRPCKYHEVPNGATIIRMEVSLDKVILKVHFRSK